MSHPTGFPSLTFPSPATYSSDNASRFQNHGDDISAAVPPTPTLSAAPVRAPLRPPPPIAEASDEELDDADMEEILGHPVAEEPTQLTPTRIATLVRIVRTIPPDRIEYETAQGVTGTIAMVAAAEPGTIVDAFLNEHRRVIEVHPERVYHKAQFDQERTRMEREVTAAVTQRSIVQHSYRQCESELADLQRRVAQLNARRRVLYDQWQQQERAIASAGAAYKNWQRIQWDAVRRTLP